MKLTGDDRTFKDALLRGTGRCFEMLASLNDANSDIRDCAKRFLSRRRVKVTSNPV